MGRDLLSLPRVRERSKSGSSHNQGSAPLTRRMLLGAQVHTRKILEK